MDPLIVTALVSIVGSISGIVGVIVGGRISASAADRAAKSAERRHFRELGMQFAMTNFNTCMEIGKVEAERRNAYVKIPPLKAFVIQGIKLMEIVGDDNITGDEMIRRISECEDFAKEIASAGEKP